jgi:hypothetical protein
MLLCVTYMPLKQKIYTSFQSFSAFFLDGNIYMTFRLYRAKHILPDSFKWLACRNHEPLINNCERLPPIVICLERFRRIRKYV